MSMASWSLDKTPPDVTPIDSPIVNIINCITITLFNDLLDTDIDKYRLLLTLRLIFQKPGLIPEPVQ